MSDVAQRAPVHDKLRNVQGAIHLLRMAIKAGDPAGELDFRCHDIWTDLEAALSQGGSSDQVKSAAQISELDDASNACLELAAAHGFATGHGDTVADMIREFSAQMGPRVQVERSQAPPGHEWDLTALDLVNQIWAIPTDWPPTRRIAHAQCLILEALKASAFIKGER